MDAEKADIASWDLFAASRYHFARNMNVAGSRQVIVNAFSRVNVRGYHDARTGRFIVFLSPFDTQY
jgi:hypothetical protein